MYGFDLKYYKRLPYYTNYTIKPTKWQKPLCFDTLRENAIRSTSYYDDDMIQESVNIILYHIAVYKLYYDVGNTVIVIINNNNTCV